ncbi:MAG: hypothetical protein NTZ97_02215 [Candidatus Moranbacteria bacterium]|nr:hypothetical protein [Candidatus Moranbacteria bacterium]
MKSEEAKKNDETSYLCNLGYAKEEAVKIIELAGTAEILFLAVAWLRHWSEELKIKAYGSSLAYLVMRPNHDIITTLSCLVNGIKARNKKGGSVYSAILNIGRVLGLPEPRHFDDAEGKRVIEVACLLLNINEEINLFENILK